MKYSQRILALLLSLVMVLSYMPAMTFAEAGEASGAETPAAEEQQAETETPGETAAEGSGEAETAAEPEHAESGGPAAVTPEEQKATETPGASANESKTEEATDKDTEDVKAVSSGTLKEVPETGIAGNDELLEQYFGMEVDKALGKSAQSSGRRKAKQARRYDQLNSMEQYIYGEVLDLMEGVANGTVSDAQIQIDMSEQFAPYYDTSDPYPGYEYAITTASLGIEGAVYTRFENEGDPYWDFTDEAKTALYDIRKTVNAVLADNPAYAYWFDKEAGYEHKLNFSYDNNGNQDVSDIFSNEEPVLSMSFTVAEAYRADDQNEYAADPAKAAALNSAVNKAYEIISESAGGTDVETLTAYKDAICNLTDYNDEAASDVTIPYGDPWQMIWVFDDNPETKVVCEGYSKAFQFLCDKTTFGDESIECHTVSGNIADTEEEGPHMWNILHMDDGRNYMADVTNSDTESAGKNGGLFIAPAIGGTVDGGYGYMDADNDGNADLSYSYDEDTRALYSDEELTMSLDAYEGASEPVQEETVIPITLDETQTVTATSEKDYQLFSFTPEKDGYYCFESSGEVDTYGYAGHMDNGEFMEQSSSDDDGEGSNFCLYFDASAGQTVYLKARTFSPPAEGDTRTFEVKVTAKARVEGIEISIAEPLSFCEHTHGSWSTDHNNKKMWVYEFPGFRAGDTLTVTYGDGAVVYTYITDEYGSSCFRAEGREDIHLGWSSNQWENGEWETGSHEFEFSYKGQTAVIPVEITESPVSSVDFTPAKPVTYVEGLDGDTEIDRNGEEFTYYYNPCFRSGDKLTVDGTDYVFSEDSYTFVSGKGNVIPDSDIDWIYIDQHSNHWGIGRHEFEFGYMGKFTSYPVEIIENPVKSIEYIPASPYVFYEGIDSYDTTTDEEGEEHYLYNVPFRRKGDRLIVNGTDTYTFGYEGELIGPDGKYAESDRIEFSTDQEDGDYWELGSSNYVTVRYRGRTCTVPVTILEPEVHEISYEPVRAYVLTENFDGRTDYGYDENDNRTEWFRYDDPYAEDGDVLTVDGKEYTKRYSEFISADGERIDSDEVSFSTDQSLSSQWSIDDEDGHYVTISYKGNNCTVPVTIEASPVTAIEFEPAEPYVFYDHVGGEWGESFEEEGDIYYYPLSEYREGDKLTVHKGEDVKVYTCRYDDNTGEAAFFTDDGADRIEYWKVRASSSQDEGVQWLAGNEYEFTVSYMGASCTVNASVVDNPVESIEYETAGGHFSIPAFTNGAWENDYEGGRHFWYWSPRVRTGDRLTVSTASGDETVYEYSETQDGACFVDVDNTENMLEMQYLYFYYNGDEYEEDWAAGSKHECIVSYMGKECLTEVWITDNPVTGFSAHLSDPLRIKDSAYDRIKHEDEDVDPVQYIDRWDRENGRGPFRTGDYITVTSAKGEQRYTLREDNNYFDNGAGEKIYCWQIEFALDIDWENDTDPKLTMCYMGSFSDPAEVEVYADPDHVHSMVHHAAVAAGCLTGGYTEYWYCSGCDRYFEDEGGQSAMATEAAVIRAAGHSWGDGTVTTEATCKGKGLMTYTCTVCGEARTQPIPATGKHRWNDGEIEGQSTCYSNGTKVYTCLDCGTEKYESLPLAPHAELVHVDPVEPTCTSSGNIEYWYCPVCYRYFSDENAENETSETVLSQLPHTLTEHPHEAATCETDGHEAYWECSECHWLFSDAEGKNYIDSPEIIAAIGHQWGEWAQTQAPTCTEQGVETRVCARDSSHEESRYIDALGHDWSGEPEYTWEADNSRVTAKLTCLRDPSHEQTETAYTSSENTATCTEAGTETITVEFTNGLFKKQNKELPSPALGHSYHDVAGSAVAASCEEDGKTADRECSRCGDLIPGEVIPKLGHNYQDIAGTSVAASCEADGRTADRRCLRCGAVIEGEVIPKLGHDLRKTEAKPATCTVNGNIEYWTCSRCGKIFSDEAGTAEITQAQTVEAAAGHDWGDPVFNFSEDGTTATATRTCARDGSHTETVTASVTSEITRIATSTQTGEITYTATAVFDEREYTDTKAVEANTYIPEAISQLSAVGDTHNIRLAWTQSHEIDTETYCIYRRPAQTDQVEMIKKINSRSTLTYTDTDVEDGKEYTYYVTCLNRYGQESAPSPEATATVQLDTEAPAVVQMRPADKSIIGGRQTITAKATDNIQVTSLVLSISVDGGSTWQQLAQADGGSISYEFDTAAYDSGDIKIKAVAHDAGNNESEPFISEYTIDNDCPAQVMNLTAEATASSVSLKWDDNSENDIKFYRVEQVISEDNIKRIDDVYAVGIILNGLKSSADYTYQVTAYDMLGNRGTPSERVTVRTADDDIAPKIVSIRPEPSYVSGKLDISVTARDNMGLDSVVIQHSRDGLSWSDLEEVKFEDSPEESTATRSIETDGLEEGSLFVRAKVTDINGNENDYLRMEPVEYKIDRTRPEKVIGLSAESGKGSISLSWTKSDEKNLRGYNVYRSEDGGEAVLITKTSGNSAVDHAATETGKTYTYQVAAVDAAGNIGELSDAVSAQASADTEAPVINTYEPSAGSKVGPGNKKFTVLVSDDSELAGMRITYTVDSADGGSDITEEQPLYENNAPGDYYLNITGDLPVDDLKDGDIIKLHIYATDAAGNELTDSGSIAYTVDKTAPTVHSVTAELQGQDVKLHISGDRVSDLHGYYIYRREPGGEREYIGSADVGAATDYDPYYHAEFTDTNTESGKTYIYIAVAYDNAGNTSYAESEEVIIPEQTIIKAQLTCDDVIEGNVEYYFSGVKSESNLGIREFSFDFGDGSDPVSGTDARVIHRYPEPAEDDADGTETYTVRLTITDNAGNTDTVERKVKVKRQALAGRVTVTVVSPDGKRLSNVPVYFDMDNTLERVKATDGNGQVQFVSDAGMYAIGAYTGGYLPIRRTMTVNANMDNEITLTLTEKEIVSGKFEVSRLTLDEIKELGIDTSDPDSMHYAKINVTLEYGEVEAVVDKDGKIKDIIKAIGMIDIFPHVKTKDKPPVKWPDGDGGGGGGNHGTSTGAGPDGGFMNVAPEISFVAILEVPVETSFLKEFFDVRLHLINNATSEFEITDNMVKLEVPDGMTLLDLEQKDSEVVRFDSLKGQESRTLDWCLRGDKAGDYTLAADYSGLLKNFAAEISERFETSEPIKVFGLGAGKVIMEVDPYVQYGAFYTKISLQNVGDADMYLPSIGIADDLIRSTETYAKKNKDGGETEVTVTGEKTVRLLNEYLEDEAGYTQAIPPGGVEVLTKGQMLSRRYACYDAIRTEDLVWSRDRNLRIPLQC